MNFYSVIPEDRKTTVKNATRMMSFILLLLVLLDLIIAVSSAQGILPPNTETQEPDSDTVDLKVGEKKKFSLKVSGVDIRYIELSATGQSKSPECEKCGNWFFLCDELEHEAEYSWDEVGIYKVTATVNSWGRLYDSFVTWNVNVTASRPDITRTPTARAFKINKNTWRTFKIQTKIDDDGTDGIEYTEFSATGYANDSGPNKDSCYIGCRATSHSKRYKWDEDGIYTVTAKIKTKAGASVFTEQWTVHVGDPNQAPTLTRSSPSSERISINKGVRRHFQVSATDPDDSSHYKIAYIIFQDASDFRSPYGNRLREFTSSWSGSYNHSISYSWPYTGTYEVKAFVVDNAGAEASVTWTVTVTGPSPPSNNSPPAATPIPAQTLTVGGSATTVNVGAYFSDPENDALNYSAKSSNEWVATVSVSDSEVMITPVNGGSTRITVTATDSGGLAATQTIDVTVQAKQSCTYSLSQSSASVPVAGGSFLIGVSTATDCAWIASSNSNFLSVTPSGGTGSDTVTVTVIQNTGTARTGTLTIAGQTLTVNQTGTAPTRCIYNLGGLTSRDVPASGESFSVSVGATSGCPWSVTNNNADFLSVTPSSGTGNGTVTVTVSRNTGAARTGSFSIARIQFTVNQAAVAPTRCLYNLGGSTSRDVQASGESFSVSIGATSGCPWSVTNNNADFLSVTPSSGTGSRTVTVTVSRNTGAARTGSFSIARIQFTVNQNAQAHTPPPPVTVCERTPQVRDAIVKASPVRNCAKVTEDHLNEIRRLSLYKDGITTLQLNDFDELRSLERLNLDNNNLRTLPAGIFWYLTELETLRLRNNQLTTLQKRIFARLSRLEYLNLAANQLTALQRKVFDNLDNLIDLHLERNQLTTLEAKVFEDLSNLEELHLYENQLTTLPIGVFNGLDSLEELYLYENQLTTLPAGVFNGLNNLIELDLEDNSLTTLPTDGFKGLASLEDLYLEGNPLTTIETGAFNGLNNFTELDLYGYSLTTIEAGAFSGLNNLTELDLDDNQLTTLPTDVFKELASLEYLTLTGNQFTTLRVGVFNGLDNLEVLYLYENQLTGLPSDVFNELNNLTTLRLDENQLTTLLAGVFNGLNNLTRLDLDENQLATLPAGVFNGLNNLTTLRLDENQLTTLPAGVFNGLNNLTTLRLNENQLTTLPVGVFEGLNSLTYLNLRNNPGGPFTLTLKLGRTDNVELPAQRQATVVVQLAQGAPFDMTVSLSVQGGTPLATTATITRGKTQSDPIAVTQSGNSSTTVSLGTTPTVPSGYSGIQMAVGDSLVLFGSVDIPDPSLRAQIETALNKQADAPITAAEMATLTTLQASNANISDLTGLEHATNLTSLELHENSISEISPLAGLTNLTNLELRGNSISDLAPLVANTGLGSGDTVTLNENPLSIPSIHIYIPILVSRGVAVKFTDSSHPVILKISGGDQKGAPGTILASPFVVEVRDANGSVVKGTSVTFAVTAGGGTLSTTSTSTDVSGRAASTLTLGNTPGTNTVTVSASGIQQLVTFNASATTSEETPLMVIEGTITNADGTFAEAGLSVTVTIEGKSQTAVSESGGFYSVTFFTVAGVVARSFDTVEVQVVQATGKEANNTIQLSSAQIRDQSATIDIQFPITEYLLSVPSGISLIHVPLKVTAVDGGPKTINSVSDLYDVLGGADTVNSLTTHNSGTQQWYSYLGAANRGTAADTALTDDLGIMAIMKAPVSIRLSGEALGTNGRSSISLQPGRNLVGIPLKDSRITRVSDLFALEGIKDNVLAIIVSDGGGIKVVAQAGDAGGDTQITGDQAVIMIAQEAATVAITGTKWSNASGITATPPIALTSIQANGATPVLTMTGSIATSDLVGRKFLSYGPVGGKSLSRPFRVTVKNLSTGKTATTVTADEALGYQLTVVDMETGRVAQIGDTLEITAQSPDPFVGVQPLRHTVTAGDVKRTHIPLAQLVAYEIPAQTELLRNYPNPFNPETWIPYRLAEDGYVTLSIYDLSGGVVRRLNLGHQIAAVYESRNKAIHWDGRNEVGERVASGIYFYHLSAGNYSATRKMVILK